MLFFYSDCVLIWALENLLLSLILVINFLAKYQTTNEWEHSKTVVLCFQSKSSGNNSTPDAALEAFLKDSYLGI